MAIVRWEPFRELERFFDEDIFPSSRLGWDLAVDVYEEKGSVVVEMNLPGINPDEIDVSVEDTFVRISGSREEEQEQKDKNYYSKEIRRGSFERTVRLPAEVKGDKAEAEYSDGVLKVTIPKREEKKGGSVTVKVRK